MSINYEAYELVVGLEVHAQLLTKSKLFCGDSAAFGGEPNRQVSPITLGYPGSLPMLNRQAVEFAVKMGLACHSEIECTNYFARKNYFYPDLPKGYQISQHTTPICKGGYVKIKTSAGEEKNVQLNRIHLEEDAGKSLHELDSQYTCIDFNRAGVPLIEIVSEPVIASSDEAHAYLTELRKILRYLEICDGNMEEGSLRCDANVSVRKKGASGLGTKIEVKNLNSMRHLKKAIEYEGRRMIELLEQGQSVIQQTRSYDASTETTFALRTKEEANDYRYFPDPDLPPFQVTRAMIERVRQTIVALPEELRAKYRTRLGLSEYDANLLSEERETADYFEELIASTPHIKAAANWLLGPIKSWLNESGKTVRQLGLRPANLARLIDLVEAGQLSFSMASSKILPALISGPVQDPWQVAVSLNLLQNADAAQLADWVLEVLQKMPEKVAEYRKGKKGLIGLFVGEVKKLSKGKADPKLTNQLLLEKLEQDSPAPRAK
jgi:aspartyl-tRNA(Asn)/glutamyl-tRNA(Gln) amidotransferase subunit B